MTVLCAESDSEIAECWPVMAQLRPHIPKENFVAIIREQFAEGYRLAFVRAENVVVAVGGFRFLRSLAWGPFCYVDDLVTDEGARSQGLGAELLNFICQEARTRSCQRLELDSGVQRFGAHRFYLRHGMWISCHHFSIGLK